MAISDIPILSMLRTRMHWQQERQRLLSENIANSDTPNFRPRDLAPLSFDKAAPKPLASLAMVATDAHHKAGTAVDGRSGFQVDRNNGFEIRPAGNAVGLEDQIMKVAGNQLDYQTVTSIYSRSLGLIKTALGTR